MSVCWFIQTKEKDFFRQIMRLFTAKNHFLILRKKKLILREIFLK